MGPVCGGEASGAFLPPERKVLPSRLQRAVLCSCPVLIVSGRAPHGVVAVDPAVGVAVADHREPLRYTSSYASLVLQQFVTLTADVPFVPCEGLPGSARPVCVAAKMFVSVPCPVCGLLLLASEKSSHAWLASHHTDRKQSTLARWTDRPAHMKETSVTDGHCPFVDHRDGRSLAGSHGTWRNGRS